MSRRFRSVLTAFFLLAPVLADATAPPGTPTVPTQAPEVALRIDPQLLAEAAEVWPVITSRENPVWPGWDASDTPILFYLPGEQDVLINHPRPPSGFVAYEGPLRFPGGRIMIRDGASIVPIDGQNTSLEVEGVPTLVVADPLSSLRQQVRGLLQDPRPPAEKARELGFRELASDPYDQLALVVHEAFHVFQDRVAPAKHADEMLLLYYPVLSVDNNVGFAKEGAALAAALKSDSGAALRKAVMRWLVLRQSRRAMLPAEAVAYEDGVEFTEGLAKYTEYRLLEALEGRTPRPEMGWVRGFRGYADLAPRRAELVATMLRHMRGAVAVNDDPYGTAPLRMRLYYSGMAIGALLDRLSSDWKGRILKPEASLTGLVESAARADSTELQKVREAVRREGSDEVLAAEKRRLAEQGQARIDAMVAEIEHGSGTGVLVDYVALETSRVALAFTPFGITVVDEDRTIFAQVPVRARFDDGSEIVQTEPIPLLRDKKNRLIRFRLAKEVSPEELARAADAGAWTGQEPHAVNVALPGVEVRSSSAVVERAGKDIRIYLRPQRK